MPATRGAEVTHPVGDLGSDGGLTERQVEHYWREGFVLVPEMVSAEELELVDVALAELLSDSSWSSGPAGTVEFETTAVDGNRLPRRLQQPYEQHEVFRQLARDDRILARVVSLLGPNLALQHSKLNLKPAFVGAEVEWHQDLTYFPHTNDDLVAVLIYLDGATERNGCLEVLRRQHRRFLDHSLPDGTFAGKVTESLDREEYGVPMALSATAGSAIFLGGQKGIVEEEKGG